MNIDNLLKDINTRLTGNAASAPVWREQFTPTSPPRAKYLLWDFVTEYFGECSDSLTSTVEGSLDVTCYSVNDDTRSELVASVLNLWLPIDVETGRRTGIGPIQLIHCFLNNVRLTGSTELFPEKGSHPAPETPGTLLTFHIKAQITEE